MSRTSTASSSPPDGERPGVPHRPAEIEAALAALGIRPARPLGQSFLTDPFVADAEAALLGPVGLSGLLEVGGGLGILTEALVRRGVRAFSVVERDPRLAAHLRRVFGGEILVREEDARSTPLEGVTAVVGNLPFSVATPLLLRFFAARIPRVVALVQREVADRLAAPPGTGAYGRLTIAAAVFGAVELAQVVPSASFYPSPAVDGRLVAFTARPGPLPVPSVPRFERVVATLFSARRKQLRNLLPRVVARADADRVARECRWPEDWGGRRPEELPPEAYFALARALGPVRRPDGSGVPGP